MLLYGSVKTVTLVQVAGPLSVTLAQSVFVFYSFLDMVKNISDLD